MGHKTITQQGQSKEGEEENDPSLVAATAMNCDVNI